MSESKKWQFFSRKKQEEVTEEAVISETFAEIYTSNQKTSDGETDSGGEGTFGAKADSDGKAFPEAKADSGGKAFSEAETDSGRKEVSGVRPDSEAEDGFRGNADSEEERAAYEDHTARGPAPRRKKTDISRRKWRIAGFILAGIQLLVSVILGIQIMRLNVLPEKYLIPLLAVLIIFVAVTVCTQFSKKTRIGGLVFGGIVSIVLVTGCIYLGRTQTVLDSVTVEDEDNFKVDNIVVAVLKDDVAQSMDDTLLYNFGIQKTIDRDNTDTAIAEIESSAGLTLSVTEFEDFSSMVRALRKGEIQAIIYNAAYNDTIEENEKDFTDEIRVLNSHEIKTKMTLTTSDMNVTQEPFTVYISGIDVYGEIEKTSRSDVNMLVTVNPQTKEILMTTTPRDYWVYLPDVSGQYRDKLTHAGIYGVQCSMDTLSQLYGIQIDYYVRVNFTTLKKIVDALGGVNVYSEYEFTTHYKNGGYDIKKGYNQMNGKVALAFARERYNVPGGDEQRGRDQQAVLKALIEKAMSPSILTGYMGILDSLEGSFETNLSMNQIASLVKMQLGDGASWEIKAQNAEGSFGSEACFSSGWQRLSVMYEDFDSIVRARNKMLETGAVAVDKVGRFGEADGTAQTDAYGNVISDGQTGTGSGQNGTDSGQNGTGSGQSGTGSGQGGTGSGQNSTGNGSSDSNGVSNGSGSYSGAQSPKYDSAVGEFADSPTIQGEDGLIEGFNYYKGNAGKGSDLDGDDASELDAKIDSEGIKVEE